jgi:hypothetical protein
MDPPRRHPFSSRARNDHLTRIPGSPGPGKTAQSLESNGYGSDLAVRLVTDGHIERG